MKKVFVGIAIASLALWMSLAMAQIAPDGTISAEEISGAELYVDDSGADNLAWGGGADLQHMYVNFDNSGVLISFDGVIYSNNGIILYIDAGVTSGTLADFSGNRGYTGGWQRNLLVETANQPQSLPDYFAAVWVGGDTSNDLLNLWKINGTAASWVGGDAIAATTRGSGTAYNMEIYITYDKLFARIGGGVNAVPANAKLGLAAIIVGGDNWSGADIMPGTGTGSTDNLPQQNGGGSDLDKAAVIRQWAEVTLDSNGDGVPDGYTGLITFAPTGIDMVFDNDLTAITFPEEIDQTSAENEANYTVVSPGDVTILQALKGTGANVNKVYLKLSRKLAAGEQMQVQSQNIAKAANPGTVSPLATQTVKGKLRILVTLDQSASDDDKLFASDKVFIKGEWNSYSFYHGLVDTGATDTMPDVPGVQSVDATANDGIRTGYIFETESDTPPAQYAYAIVGQAAVPDRGTQEYEAGYFQGNFDPKVSRTATTLNVVDPYANRRLLVDTTVNFKYHVPKTFASRAQLEGQLRLQGGGGYNGGHGVVPPMVNNTADKGELMTFVSEDANETVWEANIDFTYGANIFDVAEFRFVATALAGLGAWYEPDARQTPTIDSNYKENTIHIHVFRIQNTDGSPNNQDITMTVVEGAYSAATIDVPAPPVIQTDASSAWTLYE